MAIEQLIQTIREEAEKEVKEIIDSAEKEAKKIIEEAKKAGKKEAEKIKAQGEKEAKRTREKIIAAARRKARMEITNAKEEIIRLCIEEIRKRLQNLESKKYQKIVEGMIKDAMKEMRDFYIVATREEDEKIAEKLGIEVRGKEKGIGGVIIKTKDGSKEMDLTFDFLLDRKGEEIRIMIAKKIFGENVD